MTNTDITLETIVAQAEDVISAEVEDEVVMLRMNSSAYYNTDDIGAVIWKKIAEPITVRALCDFLMTRYDVTSEDCHRDVLAFLLKAHSEGTVRTVTSESA
jgi:coenzyme PQQ synthesis protein D (PqqD)